MIKQNKACRLTILHALFQNGGSSLPFYYCELLFGRLLFPTFFFDMFDKYEDNKLDNKKLISIYNKTTEYEAFLHNVYLIIKKRNNIISVPWLNK